MNAGVTLTPSELPDLLLNVAVVRPVFIWGPPGIGKSALVETFASSLGMPCVSLLGSQLAPEDLIGVPRFEDGGPGVGTVSVFSPPRQIARPDPYVLFLDELNACSHDVQKAFYSLIHDRRLGEYSLPEGSVVIGAGNRAQDSAIVKPMSSALLNRMLHVHLSVSHRDWLAWARVAGIHPLVLDYIAARPDNLHSEPPTHEEPFSTPRSWHMLSDALSSYPPAELTPEVIERLAYGTLTPAHAVGLRTFAKSQSRLFQLAAILKGDAGWPTAPEDRDVLYFLSQSLRAHLLKTLPAAREGISAEANQLRHRAKGLITELAGEDLELAQLVLAADEQGRTLPDWFVVEVIRDLPRLAAARAGDSA